MKTTVSGLVAFIFLAIAGYLISATWVPSPEALTQEQAQVVAVTKQRNGWYAASFQTQSGVELTCRAQKNPNAWASRCPITALETQVGQTVTVRYQAERIYEIESAGVELLGLEAQRRAQATAWGLSALLLGMALAAVFLSR